MIWVWTEKKEAAALEYARDYLSDVEIAKIADVGVRTFARWKLHPEFAKRAEEYRAKFREEIFRTGIAVQANRIKAQDERWRKMKQVVAERAVDPELANVAGGTTGLLTKTLKCIGGGENAQIIEEYVVDTGLLKAISDVEKQAAQEVGQLVQKSEVSGPDGGSIPLTLAILDAIRPDAQTD